MNSRTPEPPNTRTSLSPSVPPCLRGATVLIGGVALGIVTAGCQSLSPESVARGRAVYAQHCVACHGVEGRGNGPEAATLRPRPANLTDGIAMGRLSDPYLARYIAEGGEASGKSPAEPPWREVMSAEEIRDVLTYLRSLAWRGTAPE